jgi:hypothetical protein
MRDQSDWETQTAGLTLSRELERIVEEVLLAELEKARDRSEGLGRASPVDPAWLSEDPALD